MIKIEMTQEQQNWLLRRLKIDWDEEINYQASCGEVDTSYLEELLDCYSALLGNWRLKSEVIENMRKELEELKQ